MFLPWLIKSKIFVLFLSVLLICIPVSTTCVFANDADVSQEMAEDSSDMSYQEIVDLLTSIDEGLSFIFNLLFLSIVGVVSVSILVLLFKAICWFL